MASDFTLTQDANFNWQGTTGKKVNVKVVPSGTSVAITIANAFYPGGTAVSTNGDSVTITLVSGPADISLSIQPRVAPAIQWSVVEVGASGDQQTLAVVNAADDPYSTGVRVTGQGSGS